MAENSIRSMIQREARKLLPEVYPMKVVHESPLEMVTVGDSPIHVTEESLIIPSEYWDKLKVGATFYVLSLQDTNTYFVLNAE